MDSLVNLIRENISSTINDIGYKIYHVEYVKELGHNYLRVMINHNDISEKITIKDCEIVAKTINLIIDNLDIKDKFFLEVSSPGINRKLYTLDQMKDVINKRVCVRLMKSFEGDKKYIGALIDVSDRSIKIKIEDKELEFDLDMVKNMNLEEIS